MISSKFAGAPHDLVEDGVNGFIVPQGDISLLSKKLELLLDDDDLRNKFSNAARREIFSNGHIETMCQGFWESLEYVCQKRG